MAESRRKMPTKRRTGASSSTQPRAQRSTNIDAWISDTNKHKEFITFWKEKKIIPQKNHIQCSEKDLLIIYGILNNIHIDWPSLIIDTMMKAKSYDVYNLPYAFLVSKICEYKWVSVLGEKKTTMLPAHEIGERTP
ncbi:hypothetical protein LR48_Vigan03g133200 [Vigna angularis]|uniref:Uncharacterized protein n=1 Tax=Phaseolus angularis TaxID=3914 RepID=A0A0L9U5B2_PHAAN|nr:hypothetical protein LR48_Vigan03g133200 [Vigna angularis]